MAIKTIILAAGRGSRMVSAIPKVLHKIAGKTLLQHTLNTASQLPNNKTVIVYGYGGEQIKKALAHEAVAWVEQTQQLGTGHAVLQAAKHINDSDTVLILYADVPLLQKSTIDKLLAGVCQRTLALLTVHLANPTGYGRIIRDQQGKVRQIVEEKDASKTQKLTGEANSGIVAVHGKRLKQFLAQLQNNNAQNEFYLTDIVAMAVAENMQIHTCQPDHEDEVLGVNDRIQLAHLERAYQLRQAVQLMAQGVTLADPNRVDIRGTIPKLGSDIEIDINVILLGDNCIGSKVSIGANCIVKNSTIGDGVQILPNCIIENANIGPLCRIGPYARIRPDTTLAAAVNIGNFCEIKQTSVDEGSKINHLSYIGNAKVGKNVNIGAGAITCNYDGANKLTTTIEDDSFVGSGSQLIAPITIGRGATIGAGSTVTKDTPPQQLTLSRAKQVSVPHWQRPKK